MRFTKGEIVVPTEAVYPTGALAVDGYEKDGTLLAHPVGGGFQLRFKPSGEREFRVVSAEEQESIPWRRSTFEIEGVDERFSGWTDGRRWNGWAMPFFEFSEAERVFQVLTQGKGAFDSERDCFSIRNTDGEDETWEGKQVPTLGEKIVKVYAIGAGSWIWDEIQR
jgi:hypothetical protein